MIDCKSGRNIVTCDIIIIDQDDENKEKRTDDICSWDADFLKVDQGTLFELILAANYLDIKVEQIIAT